MNNARVTKSQGHKVTSQHWCPGVVVTWCTLFVLILTCLLLPQAKALAATYYVDIDGVGEDGILGTSDDAISSDANPGTSEQPWKTLGRAYTWYSGAGTKVVEGDTVLFKNGDYGQFKESPSDEIYVPRRSNWITYKAAAGHSPVFSDILVSAEDKWPPVVHGNSYYIFDGFTIQNGVYIKQTSYVQVKNCIVTVPTETYEGYYAPYLMGGSYAIYCTVANYITLQGNDVSKGENGIKVGEYGGEHCVIKNNLIHYFADNGIEATGANHTLIEGNTIYDCGLKRSGVALFGTKSGTFQVGETVIQAGTNAQGIVSRLTGSTSLAVLQTTTTLFKTKANGGGTVTGQTTGDTLSEITSMDGSHSDGIQIHSTSNHDILIKGNIIHGHDIVQGIKFSSYPGGEIQDVNIVNNLIYDVQKSLAIDSVNGLSLCNNTCSDYQDGARLNCGYGGLLVNAMYNNIFSKLIQGADAQGHEVRFLNHGNNIFGTNPNGTGGPTYPFYTNATELVNTTPTFVDAANGDHRLAGGSVAIDFGDPLYAPATDILGNPRDSQPDAGCYEYGASTFLYGDVSGEGEISAYDAALTAQAAVDLITLSPEQTKAADVSGNGEVSAYDAALIAQRAVGLIEKFPVEL